MASTRTPSINENAIPDSLNILSLSNRSANDEKSTHASTETPDLEPEWIDTSFGLEFQRRCSCSYIKYHQKVNKAIKPCSYLVQTHFRSFPKTSDNSFNFFCSYANEQTLKIPSTEPANMCRRINLRISNTALSRHCEFLQVCIRPKGR
jgi:hypothetical protein